MGLTRTQLRVLAALSDTHRTGALTARAIADRVNINPRTARAILRMYTRRGLATQLPERTPAHWIITTRGYTVISQPPYRDHGR
jgi:DNA-binding IclR family transcriptional regulator